MDDGPDIGDPGARRTPDSLWERIRRDPTRAPEHLALAAAERHAPAAAAWVDEQRRLYATAGAELARLAKRRHARLARVEGAAGGLGGAFTLLPDLVALAWLQARMVMYIAAAFEQDPYDPMRPAELLYLQDLYDDPQAAREALDGIGRHLARAWFDRRRAGSRDRDLVSRLGRMVGKRAANRVAGRLVPGIGAAINAVANERDTRALADRAIAFYGR